jgi:hypothetical protein
MTENAIAPVDDDATVLALARQDLKPLSPAQLAGYVRDLCRAAGIPPSLMPFQLLSTRDGRLIPYVTAAGAFFLARRNAVSLRIVERQTVDGVHLVRAEARTPDGRSAEATGGVAIEGLRAQALADAYMKAETKAFRRATLRLCGLAILDETETESVAGAVPVQIDATVIEGAASGGSNHAPSTGVWGDHGHDAPQEPVGGNGNRERAMRRLHALASERVGEDAHAMLDDLSEAAFGASSMRELDARQLEQLSGWIADLDADGLIVRWELAGAMASARTEDELREAAGRTKALGLADDAILTLVKRRRYHLIKQELRDGAVAAGA